VQRGCAIRSLVHAARQKRAESVGTSLARSLQRRAAEASMKLSRRKLHLAQLTIRQLSGEQLQRAQGGVVVGEEAAPTTVFPPACVSTSCRPDCDTVDCP
jgi:hypothetical protein